MFTHLILPLAVVASQGGDHSSLHPQNALLYVEVPHVQQIYVAYESSAYAQLLRDPECQAAVEKLFRETPGSMEDPGGYLSSRLDLISDGMWSSVQPSLSDLAGLSFSVSLKDMTGEQLFEGATQENFFDHDPIADRFEASIRMALIADFRDAQSAERLFDLVVSEAGGDQKVKTGVFAGVPAKEFQIPRNWFDDRSLGIALINNRMVIVGGENPLSYLTEQVNEKVDKSSVRRFQASHKAFPALTDKGVYTPIFRLKSTFAEQFYRHMPYKEFYVPILDLVSGALGSDVDMLLRGGEWDVQMRVQDGKGVFVTRAFQPDLNLGPFDRIFTKHPIQAEALDNVHADAALAASMTLDQQDLRAMLEHLFDVTGEDPFEMMKTTYGFSPQEDLLQHIGPAWVASLPVSSIGVSSVPGLSVWMELVDRRGLMSGLKKMQTVVTGESKGEVVLTSREYRNHTLFTFKMAESNSMLETLVRPTIVVFEDRVLVTPSSSTAKKEIRRILQNSEQRKLNPYFNRSTKPEGDVVEYSFADWGRIVARLYSGARQFVPIFEDSIGGDDLPVDLNQLPDPELFTRFFGPSYRVRTQVPGGMMVRVDSSVGPEAAGLMTMGMLFAGVSSSRTYEVQVESVESAPAAAPHEHEVTAPADDHDHDHDHESDH